MGALDKLKSFIEVNGKIDLSSLKNFRVKIVDTIGASLIHVDNTKNIIINVNESVLKDPEDRANLQGIIRRSVHDEDGRVVTEKTYDMLADITKETPEVEAEMEPFKDILPTKDIIILRTAMFMRRQHRKGVNVREQKDSITVRYGQRGSNIANLCSAGYFESHILPMYEEIKGRPNYSKELFYEMYDKIIENAPFAIFVSQPMSYNDLENTVEEKIAQNKRYGIKTLNIHGIGHDNVSKIMKLLKKDSRVVTHFIADPEISIQGKTISISLFY